MPTHLFNKAPVPQQFSVRPLNSTLNYQLRNSLRNATKRDHPAHSARVVPLFLVTPSTCCHTPNIHKPHVTNITKTSIDTVIYKWNTGASAGDEG